MFSTYSETHASQVLAHYAHKSLYSAAQMYTIPHPLTHSRPAHTMIVDLYIYIHIFWAIFSEKSIFYTQILVVVLYVSPDDIFPTKSVPVKLVVQSFVLFVVIIEERGAEGWYFYQKTNRTLYHGCAISCKVIVGPFQYPDPIREMDLFFSTTILRCIAHMYDKMFFRLFVHSTLQCHTGWFREVETGK